MSTGYTKKGRAYFAQKTRDKEPVLLTQFVLAHIDGLDPTTPIDENTDLPADDKIVHRYNIPSVAKGFVNQDQVVCSMLLTSDVGNFTFNWIGLCASDGTLISVITLPEYHKTKTVGTTQGNNLVRNVLIEYADIKNATGINVPAQTWQIDFTARLKSMDDRTRLANRDLYGRAAFFKDGFKIEKDNLGYVMKAGVAYIEGIRCVQEIDERLNILALPETVMLDVALQQKGTDVIPVITALFGTHHDYIDDAKCRHYLVDVAAVAADGTVEDKRKVVDFKESVMEYIEAAASVRGTAPALTLSGGNDHGTINEGEQFELHMPPVPASQWETKYKVRALNAEKQEVNVNPTLSGTKITCTAPQVDKETELEIQLQTWTEGQLASEWSKPFVMTVHDVPINPPTITSPADNAQNIGETPTIVITPGSADNPDAVHDGTKITITNDPAGNDEVASYTAQGAVTSWKVPAGQIQTNKHLYIHAQTSWNGVWSPKVTIDVFTSAQFTFIEAPKILAPQEGSEVMWSGLKCILAEPVIEAGGTLNHIKTNVEIYKGEELVENLEATANMRAVSIPDLERATDFTMRANFEDGDRGVSTWSDVRAFRTKNVGHGVRVDGGTAIGYPDGRPYSFADNRLGYMVVPPQSECIFSSWGLEDKKIYSITRVGSRNGTDKETGEYKTKQLASINHTYGASIGAVAARYCYNLSFEGCSDYFLPNMNELQIMYLNESLLEVSFGGNIWSSSIYDDFHTWFFSSFEKLFRSSNGGAPQRTWKYLVIPCRRILID